jgi:hypothetical protein
MYTPYVYDEDENGEDNNVYLIILRLCSDERQLSLYERVHVYIFICMKVYVYNRILT